MKRIPHPVRTGGIPPPTFLAYLDILCFKRRYPKQNTVAHLNSKICSPKIMGCLHHCSTHAPVQKNHDWRQSNELVVGTSALAQLLSKRQQIIGCMVNSFPLDDGRGATQVLSLC